uniref:Uncharacterized protein n=1 Tax=Arundo donax TaxID=35708 RepID=A0A0A9H258_ARUDO
MQIERRLSAYVAIPWPHILLRTRLSFVRKLGYGMIFLLSR